MEHPGLIDTDAVEILGGRTSATPLREVYGYRPGWGLPSAADRQAVVKLMATEAPQGGSAPPRQPPSADPHRPGGSTRPSAAVP
ncbi:hypothetical protein GCM10029963_08420 [Micromonospora andamanensis]